MYYFYILDCSDKTRYYGHSDNLSRRLKEHSKGKVYSTRNKRPVELIYYQECNSRSEAFKREMQFKNGMTRKKTIEKLINSFPRTKCQGFNSHSDLCSSFDKLRMNPERSRTGSLSFHKSRAH